MLVFDAGADSISYQTDMEPLELVLQVQALLRRAKNYSIQMKKNTRIKLIGKIFFYKY